MFRSAFTVFLEDVSGDGLSSFRTSVCEDFPDVWKLFFRNRYPRKSFMTLLQ